MNNESHESSSIGNQMLMNIKASTQSEQNEYPDNQEPIRKTYIEQKDRKDKELNNLLNNMKDKMDKGRNLNSPMSSMSFTGNNFSNNISNRNSGISQSPFSGNNIGMNMSGKIKRPITPGEITFKDTNLNNKNHLDEINKCNDADLLKKYIFLIILHHFYKVF